MAQSEQTEHDELGRPIAWRDGLAQTAAQQPTQPLQPLQLTDDCGRHVLTRSADSGTTLRRFDAADRLVAMTDAQGNTARYEHDPQGRILKQTITDAKAQADTLTPTITTEWRYSPRQRLEVIHPTQRERFEVDARGLRTARIVTRPMPHGERGGELVAVTRYEHDETGLLVASTLPDGSRLVYEHSGQNKLVALRRQTLHIE